MFRLYRGFTRVEQVERPRTVGTLRLAGGEAALPEERGLLIARDAADRYAVGEKVQPLRDAVLGHARLHVRQRGAGYTEVAEQFVVPLHRVDVKQQRAARVGRVGGVNCATCKPPDEEGIDRAERQFPAVRNDLQQRRAVEEPPELRARKVRVEHEPGLRGQHRLIGRVLAAKVGGAAVLPHDRTVNRAPGGPVPRDRRFALVGDPDRGHRPGVAPRPRERLAHRARDRVPDVFRFVLHPTVVRVVLFDFLLRGAEHVERFCVVHHGARTGGSLVDCENNGRGHRTAPAKVQCSRLMVSLPDRERHYQCRFLTFRSPDRAQEPVRLVAKRNAVRSRGRHAARCRSDREPTRGGFDSRQTRLGLRETRVGVVQ